MKFLKLNFIEMPFYHKYVHLIYWYCNLKVLTQFTIILTYIKFHRLSKVQKKLYPVKVLERCEIIIYTNECYLSSVS